MSFLDWFQKKDISQVVADFPVIFDQAVSDWAKYKIAMSYLDVPLNKRQEIEEWFAEFPKLWEAVRPNWMEPLPGGTVSPRKMEFAKKVDSWVASLRADPVIVGQGLGIPVLIIAGVLIAGALGVGGAIWAIGYVKKQNNVSRLITEVTAGRIPPAILAEAVKQERGGILSDIAGVGKTLLLVGALGVGALYLLPLLSKARR